MPFPISPTNGQQTTQNGIVYTYDSTLGVWTVGTNAGIALSANTLAVSNSATVGTTLQVSGAANLSSTLTVAGTANLSSTLGVLGTITGGNLATGGTLLATSTITGGNLATGGTLSVAGNVTSALTVTGGDMTFNNGLADGSGITFKSAGFTDYQIDNASGSLRFFQPGVARGQFDASGHFSPGSTNAQDLGTSSLRWRNIYTNDLQLSNGIGDYTIVEGEQDLFLYNNKTNKTFKFALIEVDPNTVPPKANTD